VDRPVERDLAAHAAELLVAGHPARPGGGLVHRQLRRAADGLEGQREGVPLAAEEHAPALERDVDGRAEPRQREGRPVSRGVHHDVALGDRRDRAAAVEQERERGPAAGVALAREAEAGEPVELRRRVGEGEQDRVGVPARGEAVLLGPDRHGRSPRSSTSWAVPSTSGS
jgi:hypothetical protein